MHALHLRPAPLAAKVVAALKAHVSADRIHPRAGAAGARLMRQALAAAVLGVVVFVGGRSGAQ